MQGLAMLLSLLNKQSYDGRRGIQLHIATPT